MLFHYLKIAFRQFSKYPAQILVNIVGLAIGFAFFTVWMSSFNLQLPDDFPGDERSFRLLGMPKVKHSSRYPIPGRFIDELPKRIPQIQEIIYYTLPREINIKTGAEDQTQLYQVNMMEIDPQYFRFFSRSLSQGEIPDTDQPLLVLDKKSAEKIFGQESPVGKTVYIDQDALTVCGVVESSGLQFYANIYRVNTPGILAGDVNINVKMNDHVSVVQLNEKLESFEYIGKDGTVQRLGASSLNMRFKHIIEVSFMKIMLFLIGSLLLITALLNYISYTQSRFYRRIKECGIRKVNGSSHWNLFLLFFTEILVALILSAALSLFLSNFFLNYYNSATTDFIPFAEVVRNFAYYFLWAIVFAVLLCMPVVTKINMISSLSVFTEKKTSGKRLFFAGVQTFISTVLIIFSIWMFFQINRLYSSAYPGLSDRDKQEIIVMNPSALAAVDADLPEQLVGRIVENPNISDRTLTESYGRYVSFAGNDNKTYINVFYIDDRYFSFFNIRLLEGRFPTVDETHAVVVDQLLADELDKENSIIGRHIEIPGKDNRPKQFVIVGICERTSVHIGPGRDMRPSCFIMGHPEAQEVYFRINSINLNEALASIRKLTFPYTSVIPGFNVVPLKEKIVNHPGAMFVYVFRIALIIACAGLALTLFGIYSSVALNIESRRHEVAIRKVNGANTFHIFILFGESYLYPAIIAWALASLLMWPILGFMVESSFTEVQRFTPNIFFYLGVLFLLVLVISVTILIKVRDVSKTNPIEGIKQI